MDMEDLKSMSISPGETLVLKFSKHNRPQEVVDRYVREWSTQLTEHFGFEVPIVVKTIDTVTPITDTDTYNAIHNR